MGKLLIKTRAPRMLAADHYFGGWPVVPHDQALDWPHCKSCRGPMQFLGRLRLPAGKKLVLLFMCQNEPGLCDEWEPDAGGNCAVVVRATGRLKRIKPPPGDRTVRKRTYGAMEVRSSVANYNMAREKWAEKGANKMRDVLGQLLGKPAWIQADETPRCNHCKKRMQFLAQLEEGPDWKTAMNFGGGCAYLFHCDCKNHTAKFLWQC